MSHRVFDEIAELRRRLAEVDEDIRIAKLETVVDFGTLSDLRITRGTLEAQIALKEEAAAR